MIYSSRYHHVHQLGGERRSLIYSGCFYSASSSAILLRVRGAPHYSTDTVSEFHAKAPQATAGQGHAQGPYVAAGAGFESTVLRTKDDESTNELPRSTKTMIFVITQNH